MGWLRRWGTSIVNWRYPQGCNGRNLLLLLSFWPKKAILLVMPFSRILNPESVKLLVVPPGCPGLHSKQIRLRCWNAHHAISNKKTVDYPTDPGFPGDFFDRLCVPLLVGLSYADSPFAANSAVRSRRLFD